MLSYVCLWFDMNLMLDHGIVWVTEVIKSGWQSEGFTLWGDVISFKIVVKVNNRSGGRQDYWEKKTQTWNKKEILEKY